jgi:2-polyprenyl-6-methoxyphenol hydroxylase-like FAD-dependent oxidoreductase
MPALKPITVVGGGLAGLTLGIGLRQRALPVTLWEAGSYPRHSVCGEFISGEGEEVLRRLDLHQILTDAGAIAGRTAAFFLGGNSTPARKLATPALCLSRFEMDALLAKKFRELGGELRERTRWGRECAAEGLVVANGRRVQSREGSWRWFGLKAHATGVRLAADLEMHGSRDSYVGLCRLPENRINVCGLFRRRAGSQEGPADWRQILRGRPDTSLHRRLESAVFDEATFRSVAGLSYRPRRARERTECVLGDALTMIPPVTGNGMSMAFEAAELALEPLACWSRGESAWADTRAEIAHACDRAFARRLAWGRLLQYLMFSPVMRTGIGGRFLSSDWLWRLLFANTR